MFMYISYYEGYSTTTSAAACAGILLMTCVGIRILICVDLYTKNFNFHIKHVLKVKYYF